MPCNTDTQAWRKLLFAATWGCHQDDQQLIKASRAMLLQCALASMLSSFVAGGFGTRGSLTSFCWNLSTHAQRHDLFFPCLYLHVMCHRVPPRCKDVSRACHHCKQKFCMRCQVPWHDSLSCTAFQALPAEERSNSADIQVGLPTAATTCMLAFCFSPLFVCTMGCPWSGKSDIVVMIFP